MMKIINKIFLFTAFVLLVCSCSDSKSYRGDKSEGEIAPVGTYKITQAARNGEDITEEIDFSAFRLHLLKDGSYSIENYLPFVVQKNGGWEVDKLQGPTKITFTNSASSEPSVGTMSNYKIVNEVKIFDLSFHTGCLRNVYTYTLEEELDLNLILKN